jgi:hypothetical protein
MIGLPSAGSAKPRFPITKINVATTATDVRAIAAHTPEIATDIQETGADVPAIAADSQEITCYPSGIATYTKEITIYIEEIAADSHEMAVNIEKIASYIRRTALKRREWPETARLQLFRPVFPPEERLTVLVKLIILVTSLRRTCVLGCKSVPLVLLHPNTMARQPTIL